MSLAYATSSSLDTVLDLEEQILDYLREKKSSPAADLVQQISSQHPFLSRTPIVAAIWNLNSKSAIRVGSDWMVTLRERPSE